MLVVIVVSLAFVYVCYMYSLKINQSINVLPVPVTYLLDPYVKCIYPSRTQSTSKLVGTGLVQI